MRRYFFLAFLAVSLFFPLLFDIRFAVAKCARFHWIKLTQLHMFRIATTLLAWIVWAIVYHTLFASCFCLYDLLPFFFCKNSLILCKNVDLTLRRLAIAVLLKHVRCPINVLSFHINNILSLWIVSAFQRNEKFKQITRWTGGVGYKCLHTHRQSFKLKAKRKRFLKVNQYHH